MTNDRIRQILALTPSGSAVTLSGWVKSARHSKNVSFLAVSDGSTMEGVQVVCPPEMPGYEETVRGLGTGAAVVVRGTLVESPAEGQAREVQASSVELVGPVGEDYPLQKKRHSFEFLRTIGHLRLRTNTLGAVLRVRNAASRAIHDFFQSRGFLWLHAPIITASDCEGAGQMFRVSTLDPADPPRTPDGAVDFARDFFGREARLTVSGQLEGEIAALAAGRVYTFGPTFRAEDSHTSRHLAEFWMVEPEMAFCDLAGDVALAEAFVREVTARVLADCEEEMAFFDKRIAPGRLELLRHVTETPFRRMSYTEAIEALRESGKAFEYPPEWGADLQTEHERFLTEEHLGAPVVVTDYPKAIKAFYMYENDGGETVRAMDVLVPGVGEIIGGSQREDREEVLRRRIGECGLEAEDYWWYLELRRHGGTPHSGFGLGFERLVQFLTGMQNIRDVIPFPRVPGSAEF